MWVLCCAFSIAKMCGEDFQVYARLAGGHIPNLVNQFMPDHSTLVRQTLTVRSNFSPCFLQSLLAESHLFQMSEPQHTVKSEKRRSWEPGNPACLAVTCSLLLALLEPGID